MGWAKFDDQFTDHPKVVQAGPMAELLHMRAVIYCARHETDGLVVEAALSRLAIGVTSPKKQVAALVRVGLWDEDPEGWRIHDFLEYHPSREDKDRERAEARERMQKARSKKRSGSVRTNTPRTEEEPAANNGRSSRNPDPTRPREPKGSRVPSRPPNGAGPEELEIHAAFEELFGVPADTDHSMRRKFAKSLVSAGATHTEVMRRHKAYPKLFPETTPTPQAIERHWGQLGLIADQGSDWTPDTCEHVAAADRDGDGRLWCPACERHLENA